MYHRVIITSVFDLKTKTNCSVSIFSHHMCKGNVCVDSSLFVEIKKIVSAVCSLYRKPSGPSGRSLSPGFCSMKHQGILLLPLDGILVYRRVTPSIKFASTLLYKKRHCESQVSCQRNPKNTTLCPQRQPGHEAGPLDLETSVLTVRCCFIIIMMSCTIELNVVTLLGSFFQLGF